MSDNIDRAFVERQVRQFCDSYALKVVRREDVSEEALGFGSARQKEEGTTAHYDQMVHLRFPERDTDIVRGYLTPTRLRRLLAKAEDYVRRMAGFTSWSAIIWRAEPELVTERDIELCTDRTVLHLRFTLADSL